MGYYINLTDCGDVVSYREARDVEEANAIAEEWERELRDSWDPNWFIEIEEAV
jgi:hypothetical protein